LSCSCFPLPGVWQDVQLCGWLHPLPGAGIGPGVGDGGGGDGGPGGGGGPGGDGGLGGVGGGGGGGGGCAALPHFWSAGLQGSFPLYVLQSITAVPYLHQANAVSESNSEPARTQHDAMLPDGLLIRCADQVREERLKGGSSSKQRKRTSSLAQRFRARSRSCTRPSAHPRPRGRHHSTSAGQYRRRIRARRTPAARLKTKRWTRQRSRCQIER
jgi:hypothetical protein